MKRMISFMMALALILSLGVTAFAAETGTITISNATVGETYSVYKIFNATYNADGDVAYTVIDNEDFVNKMFVNPGTGNTYFDYNTATGVVTLKDSVNNADLFTYLRDVADEAAAVAGAEATSTTLSFSGLEPGYYVITRSNGTANAVTITTAKPNANVHDKNSLPGGDFDKTSDKETANVGDTINWTLTFTATNYDDGEKVLSYTLKDTLTPTGWAAIDTTTIQVKVNGAVITDWTLVSGNANGFEILIPWVDADNNFKYDIVTTPVEVTYSATVLPAAATDDIDAQNHKNSATLEWTNTSGPVKPGDPGVTITKVYNMGFTKVDGADSSPLANAEFVLYRDAACTEAVKVEKLADGLYIVNQDQDNVTVVTPADGKVVIKGLAEGTYYLKETKAPVGYNKLDAAQTVNVSKETKSEFTIGEVTYDVSCGTVTIANNSGVELPSNTIEGIRDYLTVEPDCTSLNEYLEKFAIPVSVLQKIRFP